jgi:hypothetical protein
MLDRQLDNFYLKYLDDESYKHIRKSSIDLIVEINKMGISQYHTAPLQLYYNSLTQKVYYDFEPRVPNKKQGQHICTVGFMLKHIGNVKQLLITETLSRIVNNIDLRTERYQDKVGGLELLKLLYTTQWTVDQELEVSKSRYFALVLRGTRDKYQLSYSLSCQPGFYNGIRYLTSRSKYSTPCQEAVRSLIKDLEENKSYIYIRLADGDSF